MSTEPATLFVYGTLMQGQQRGGMWPRRPLAIVPAEVRGELYDLGPYPALVEGHDRIAGEAWTFDPSDLPEVLRVLDAIECYDQPGEPNIYIRTVVDYTSAEQHRGPTGRAQTYLYACKPVLLLHAQRLTPEEDGLCRWRPTKN